jgi:hypothetical protein
LKALSKTYAEISYTESMVDDIFPEKGQRVVDHLYVLQKLAFFLEGFRGNEDFLSEIWIPIQCSEDAFQLQH